MQAVRLEVDRVLALWSELKSIKPVLVTVFLGQIAGGTVGVIFLRPPSSMSKLWIGAALATLPSFFLGLAMQAYLGHVNIRQKRFQIAGLGLLATWVTTEGLVETLRQAV
jgi:hypothetical protein